MSKRKKKEEKEKKKKKKKKGEKRQRGCDARGRVGATKQGGSKGG